VSLLRIFLSRAGSAKKSNQGQNITRIFLVGVTISRLPLTRMAAQRQNQQLEWAHSRAHVPHLAAAAEQLNTPLLKWISFN
jgi:hypothetical protein